MTLPKLIDNERVELAQVLRNISSEHKHLSIATGYWDLKGTLEIIDNIEDYESIRLLIGQEPLSDRLQSKFRLDLEDPENMFPEHDFIYDLESEASDKNLEELRNTASKLSDLIQRKILKVKVLRVPRLHAKAYIFGAKTDNNAVGIVGSSNFTRAGLKSNTELNSLENEPRIVTYQPTDKGQEHGHLSWFQKLWEHENAIDWTGKFSEIVKKSPVGDKTYGAYEVYIKTLMEVYEDEILPPQELDNDSTDVLYSFQKRNAGILINKLNKKRMAILADSVGLGKTITSGAVIKHYLDQANDNANIQIIAPAALKNQWIDDLSSVLEIDYRDGAFNIVSQQDVKAIRSIKEYYDKEWRKTKNIDLFVIDEAHNLRSSSGSRHDAILELLQQHPDAHILLLTATPINNSLMDIANQIQLASKGRRISVNVPYIRPNSKEIEMLDFFEALKRIQTMIKKAEKNNEDVEKILRTVKPTIHEGLRNYLVRSTRQGVEAEGGIIDSTGNSKAFPKSDVESIQYKYDEGLIKSLFTEIGEEVSSVFEGIDPRYLNLLLMSEFTQQTSHPLDFMKKITNNPTSMYDFFNLNESSTEELGNILNADPEMSLVPNILQAVFLLGFTPYKPEVYKHKFYGKTIEEINSFNNVPNNLRIQMSVHNILQITWLKRMESSGSALLTSIKNYVKRINLFEKYLDRGYVVNLSEASLLESDYNDGEDIDKAFDDYEKYLKEKEQYIAEGKDEKELKKYGVEKRKANPKVYNIDQMKRDMERDRKILNLLIDMLEKVARPENDIKMKQLAEHLYKTIKSNEYGKKAVVFSFFADTVQYLKDNLGNIMREYIPDFNERAEFIYGKEQNTNQIVARFSPQAKKHKLKETETEIDFLFSTDILSEGQNLQDSGYLINYDLHWNPVRMIQRNGRVNRLGSTYSNVLIANMRPTDELEVYLKLVNRLERKIKTIRNSIGLDQGVLTNKDINPIEFIEKYYEDGTLPEIDDDLLADNDEHIIALRTFMAEYEDDQQYINQIKNMPKGKWNYLPQKSSHDDSTLALVKATGKTKETEKEISELFFVDVSCVSEYIATYLEYTHALDLIKTPPEDNNELQDRINYDRLKVISRSNAEAKRQAHNPETYYKIKPSFEKALLFLKDYFDPRIDLKGTIEQGVTTINLQKGLERVLRNVNKQLKSDGTVHPGTIKAFEKIFKFIQNNTTEEKIILNTEGVLYYAGKQSQ